MALIRPSPSPRTHRTFVVCPRLRGDQDWGIREDAALARVPSPARGSDMEHVV